MYPMLKKVFSNKYKCTHGRDGLVDTIDTLLKDYTVNSSEFIAKIIFIMVKCFQYFFNMFIKYL